MSTLQVLRRPLMTEKSTRLREENQYVVEVDLNASKGDIRIALETRYKVNVVSVKTMRTAGKFRRRGQMGGYQSDKKKAIVRLKEGQKISWEEGK